MAAFSGEAVEDGERDRISGFRRDHPEPKAETDCAVRWRTIPARVDKRPTFPHKPPLPAQLNLRLHLHVPGSTGRGRREPSADVIVARGRFAMGTGSGVKRGCECSRL